MNKETLIESNHVLTYNSNTYSVNKLMNNIYKSNNAITYKHIELESIKHMLTNKIWIYDKLPLSPQMVIDEPDKYSKIYNDIIRSDIFYPVIILYIDKKMLLIDGHHRVTKSIIFNIPSIDAYIIDLKTLNKSIL